MAETHSFFRPTVPNPYPDAFSRIDGFDYATRLVLAREPRALRNRKGREMSYVVAEPYTVAFRVDGVRRELTVPQGMLTDLTSTPAFARSVVGRVGPHLEAAIVHDYLFIAWQLLPDYGPRERDFEFANAVMFAALDAAKISRFSNFAIRVALTSFGVAHGVYRETDDPLFVELDASYASLETGVLAA